MALTQKHVQNVCLWQQDGQCRFLDQDAFDYMKFICKKKSPEKKVIEEEVDEFLKECKDKNVNPYSAGQPIGDNCSGYLPLQVLPQGYDVDKK